MKKTVSFSLEEDVIDIIEKFKKNNKLSSKSSALERIVLGYKITPVDDEYIENIVKKYIGVTESKKESSKPKIDKLDTVISDSFNNMPD